MEKLETKDLVSNKKNCCGCGLCQTKCPVRAIAMKVDEEGFLYPVIEREDCIGCKICVESCIMRASIVIKKEKHNEQKRINTKKCMVTEFDSEKISCET